MATSRRNRPNPLDEARSLGETLAYHGVKGATARCIVEDFAFELYHKPRARPYRRLYIDSAMRGYESTRKYG